MKLKKIILHQIIKETGEKAELNCSDYLLSNDNEDILDFVNRFLKIYNKRRPTHGSFKNDIENFPFQKYAKEYLINDDFIDFSKKSMETLKKSIDKPSTKGGYVFFFHYENLGKNYIVTTMLDNAPQFSVNDEKLIIEKLKALNLDELVRANRIDINKWDNNEDSYLTFIKGKRAVSVFFQEFIGNTDLTSEKMNANNLNKALRDYIKHKGFDSEIKQKLYRDIHNYVYSQIRNKEDIILNSISAILNHEDPEDFVNFTIKNDRDVSGNFSASKVNDFQFLNRTTIKGTGYTLDFNKKLISDGKITRSGNNIIIKDIDSDILDFEFNKP